MTGLLLTFFDCCFVEMNEWMWGVLSLSPYKRLYRQPSILCASCNPLLNTKGHDTVPTLLVLLSSLSLFHLQFYTEDIIPTGRTNESGNGCVPLETIIIFGYFWHFGAGVVVQGCKTHHLLWHLVTFNMALPDPSLNSLHLGRSLSAFSWRPWLRPFCWSAQLCFCWMVNGGAISSWVRKKNC